MLEIGSTYRRGNRLFVAVTQLFLMGAKGKKIKADLSLFERDVSATVDDICLAWGMTDAQVDSLLSVYFAPKVRKGVVQLDRDEQWTKEE